MRQSDELQGARDYLEAVLGHMVDGVIAFGERGAVLLCNPAAQQLLGLPHGAAPVAEWDEYAHWYAADGRARLAPDATPVARARRGSTVRAEDVVVAHAGARTADGARRRTLAATARPVRDRAGRYRGAILVLHDITDRKSAERLKNELVSVVSHELRTPLTSIRGSLGLLEGGAYGELPDRVRRLVSIGRSNTDRLIRLVNDLLDLEKLQAGRLELRHDPVAVGGIVATSVEGVRSFAAQHGVRLEVRPERPEVAALVVRGDADRLTQVLTNLLSNAVKFSPPGAAVTLAVTQPAPDTVRLEVADEGPGIAEHDLPRLFHRFEQLDASDTRRHGGTGLGLAISKDLVEQHGGAIGVVSRRGEGARFWVELPCPRRAVAPPADSAPVEPTPVEPAPRAADTLASAAPAPDAEPTLRAAAA
jgi:signal transduction histidine kinase